MRVCPPAYWSTQDSWSARVLSQLPPAVWLWYARWRMIRTCVTPLMLLFRLSSINSKFSKDLFFKFGDMMIYSQFGKREYFLMVIIRILLLWWKGKVLKDGKQSEFYFVIETKGTNDINDKKALKESEIYKIECARKHFSTLGVEVQYKAAVKD